MLSYNSPMFHVPKLKQSAVNVITRFQRAYGARAVVASLGIYLLCAMTMPAMATTPSTAGAELLQPRQLWIQNRFSGESRLEDIPAPDTSLWNQARIEDYLNSLTVDAQPPLGVLIIEKIGLEVPVYNGTGDLELDLGAGRIPGTGTFYGAGNLGISAHRDGFFRGLKDLQIGDTITLRGVNGDQVFTINNFSTVHKTDHAALKTSNERMLTLVTCHPFYFVGEAPERYLVQAVPVSSSHGSSE